MRMRIAHCAPSTAPAGWPDMTDRGEVQTNEDTVPTGSGSLGRIDNATPYAPTAWLMAALCLVLWSITSYRRT